MTGHPLRRTMVGALAAVALGVSAQVPQWSLQARRRLWGGPGGDVNGDLAERHRLAIEGESRLARGDATGARSSFEAAAGFVHSADVELGIVRSQMLAGDYRQALAFAAHVAGAHRDVPEAAALYVWLLAAGGQRVAAQRLLLTALERAAGNAALVEAAAALGDPWLQVGPALMEPPLRLAPYGWPIALDDAETTSTATLLADGRSAIAPAAGLRGAREAWLRNGLGQTVAAHLERVDEATGAALLRLTTILPLPSGLQTAAREPFAGSPGHVLEYHDGPARGAAWPLLFQGFFARQSASAAPRALGVEMPPGTRGGPVFDVGGSLVGIAMPTGDGRGRLLALSALPEGWCAPGLATGPAATGTRPIDQIYESGLLLALQVLVVR